jgi:hypothetical protein
MVFEEDHAWRWTEEEVRDSKPFKMEYIVAGAVHPTTQVGGMPESARSVEAHMPPVLEVHGAVEHLSLLANVLYYRYMGLGPPST